jgi:multicomponent Na+:H+ antiporter subunit G
MFDTIAGLFTLAGALLVLLAGVGVLRFPDLYSRMHAATKATTLGLALIAVGAVISLDSGAGKLILAVVFLFITAPASSHFVGRAAYRAEGIDIRLQGPDDLRSLIDESDEPIGP